MLETETDSIHLDVDTMLQHDTATAFSIETWACAFGPAASLCSSLLMKIGRAVGPGQVPSGAQLSES